MDRGLAEGHQAVIVEFTVDLFTPKPDQLGTTLLRGGHLTSTDTARAGGPDTMVGALVFAVRDVLPFARALDAKALAAELDRGLRTYWGPDHGITSSEMLATAHDIKNSAAALN